MYNPTKLPKTTLTPNPTPKTQTTGLVNPGADPWGAGAGEFSFPAGDEAGLGLPSGDSLGGDSTGGFPGTDGVGVGV